MPKQAMLFEQQEQIAPLPFKPIIGNAFRETLRNTDVVAKIGRQTYMIEFKKIKLRENYNPSKRATRNIRELADSIASVGLIRPLVVKIDAKGVVWLIFGHRRRNALQMLHDEKRLSKLKSNGLDNGAIECFVLPANLTELDLLKMGGADNLAEKDSIDDLIERALLMKNSFKISNEQIGASIGKSRAWVDTMMLIENEPGEYLKTGMDAGILSITNAGIIARIDATGEQKERFIHQFTTANTLILMSDIENFRASVKKPPTPIETKLDAGGKGIKALLENIDADLKHSNGAGTITDNDQDEEEEEEEDIDDDEDDQDDDGAEDETDHTNAKDAFVSSASKTPVKVIAEDTSAEERSHQTSAKANPNQVAEKKINDVPDVVIECTEIMKGLDQMNNYIGKLPQAQRIDMETLMFHLIRRAADHKETVLKLVKQLK